MSRTQGYPDIMTLVAGVTLVHAYSSLGSEAEVFALLESTRRPWGDEMLLEYNLVIMGFKSYSWKLVINQLK